MRLSSIEIRKQEFKKVMRGFDPVEVEAFLEMVADEYELMHKSNAELKDRVAKLEERVREFERVENDLKKTLTEAQHSADASKVYSRKEADLVVKEAEFKADQLAEDARREIARLKSELTMLESSKRQLAGRLKQLLNSQLELIKILELEGPEIAAAEKKEEPQRGTRTYTPLSARDAASARRQEPGADDRRAQPSEEKHASEKAPPAHPAKPAEARETPRRQDLAGERQGFRPAQPPGQRKDPETQGQPPEEKKRESKINTDDLIDRMILEHERREEESRKPRSEGSEPGGEQGE